MQLRICKLGRQAAMRACMQEVIWNVVHVADYTPLCMDVCSSTSVLHGCVSSPHNPTHARRHEYHALQTTDWVFIRQELPVCGQHVVLCSLMLGCTAHFGEARLKLHSLQAGSI